MKHLIHVGSNISERSVVCVCVWSNISERSVVCDIVCLCVV